MARFKMDMRGYLAKKSRLLMEARLGAERASRWEARNLARAMKRVSPVRTGHMRRNIRVRKSRPVRGRKRRFYWQVYIPRSKFPRFFYPILYLSGMYKKIAGARVRVRRRFQMELNQVFRRVFKIGRF